MYSIRCSARIHREEERIFIESPFQKVINDVLRRQAGIRFSKTHGQWHLPLQKEAYHKLSQALAGIAVIDHTALSKYLEKKSAGQTPVPSRANPPSRTNPIPAAQSLKTGKRRPAPPFGGTTNVYRQALSCIAHVNSHVLPNFKQQLVLRAYSNSTIRTYMNEMSQYLLAIKQLAADEIPVERIKKYMQFCFQVLKLSEHTVHSRINALKFYYEQVLRREKFFWEVPRPKKPQQLPRLLNENELTRLFNALINKKHKAMLFTAYSAGLRVSEIVSLRIADVDSSRMQILLTRAKGKKDRYVNLSPVLLDILRQYFKTYRPAPKVYLFESEATGSAYPTRTVQQIFSQAKQAAGIRKDVGIHSLRHSFATHLLEKGTDIRYIKDILGHFNIRTTERYLHVANQQLVNIVSPFDDLWKKDGLEW